MFNTLTVHIIHGLHGYLTSLFIIYSTEVEFAILNAMLDANAKKLGSDGFSKLQKC